LYLQGRRHRRRLSAETRNSRFVAVSDAEESLILSLAVAHKVYGVPQTINTANYVYFLAYQELSALRPTIRRSYPASSASSDSGLGDDSPAAEKFPERIIPDYDLDLVVNSMSFVVIVAQTVVT